VIQVNFEFQSNLPLASKNRMTS